MKLLYPTLILCCFANASKLINYDELFQLISNKEQDLYWIERGGILYENEMCNFSAIPDKIIFCWVYIHDQSEKYAYSEDMSDAHILWKSFIKCKSLFKSGKFLFCDAYVNMQRCPSIFSRIAARIKGARFYEKAVRAITHKGDLTELFKACNIPLVECSQKLRK